MFLGRKYLEENIKKNCVISSGVLVIITRLFKSVITASTTVLIPFLKCITFTPVATDLQPSVNFTCVRTIAQFVPSPTAELVALAICTNYNLFITIDVLTY